jgi:hypothetical protein
MLVKYLLADRTKHLKRYASLTDTTVKVLKKNYLETIRDATIMLLATVQSRVATCWFLRSLQVLHHPPLM